MSVARYLNHTTLCLRNACRGKCGFIVRRDVLELLELLTLFLLSGSSASIDKAWICGRRTW